MSRRSRLDAQQWAVVFVSEQIEEPVGSFANLPLVLLRRIDHPGSRAQRGDRYLIQPISRAVCSPISTSRRLSGIFA